ncbi:putative nuclease HARBI1 [Eriocheir sinensis]|uniref:putative nuclease HARBI1 n=1 Tax=Eriocheir sinensis TaxID=95602 RepID=UPI0021C63203|nr:putative nuclease HARBI1 [Eriocheir sinensis]
MFHESSQALELCLSRSPPWEAVRGLPSAPKEGSKGQTVNMAAREQQRQHRPRNFRPRRDIFNEYDDTEFKKRYRVDRAGLLFITDLVQRVIGNRTERSRAVTAELKVALTLRYLATGKMQQCNADDFGVSRATVSRIITQTVDALVTQENMRRFMGFPLNRGEQQRMKAEFAEIAGFPGVVGAVDGTHVRIVAPHEHEEVYVNRKNYHSINVQVLFDAQYKLRDMVARWPGSTHDSRILRESGLWDIFEQNLAGPGCYILGDSGYPSKRWLLTPYPRPQEGHQAAYNSAHKRTRSVVERGIGQLKRRFHVLHGEIRLEPRKACRVIMACGILHNICKLRNIELDEEDDIGDEPAGDGGFQPEDGRPAAVHEGALFREHIARQHFRVAA